MSDLSVSEIQVLLSKKQRRLQTLETRREKLVASLRRIEQEIAAIKGRGVSGPRPKNEKPLLDYVTDILGRNKSGLTLAELEKKVLAAGYKTNSGNFSNVIYQGIYHCDDVIHDPEVGRYRRKPR